MLVLDTHHLELLLERLGVGLGNIHFRNIYYWIYPAYNWGNKCCYKICHASSWGMNVSWVVFVCPSGLGIYFQNIYLCWK